MSGWLLPLLLATAEALARAGGGHGYSNGSSSSSGGGYSGGGSSGGDGLGLLIWLLVEHPAIGIPVLVVVAIVWVVQQKQRAGGTAARQVFRTHHEPARTRVPSLDFLVNRDPTFSLPLFHDLSRLVYVRAQEERGRDNLAALQAFVAPAVAKALRARNPATTEVRDVIIGASSVAAAATAGAEARIVVRIEANLTEVTAGRPQQLLVQERWTFARSLDARSPGPDKMRALACPSCGSPAETRLDGTCTRCDTVIDDGRLQWRVVEAQLLASAPLPAIVLQPGGGVEEGTATPLVAAPDLAVRMRELSARHPDFQWAAFQERVTETFLAIQAAWSAGKYEAARPYETDFLFQQHRYWIERYRREGLRNRLSNVQVVSVVPAKVVMDAYVEAITVRVFARMRDWTETQDGRLVGGSKTSARVFSEYWTFLRSAGAQGASHTLTQCPSCGAPLDKVNETGVCGYCEAKITGGEFDWVVSAIDQDEAYAG